MIPSVVFIMAIALRSQFFTRQNIEKFWWYAKDVYTCFVDLVKEYNQVSCEKLWRVLREYGIDHCLLLDVKSLHFCAQVYVHLG